MFQDGSVQKLQKVEITLADCLACSGCITSAESVLVTQQSQEELLKVFEENKILKIASITKIEIANVKEKIKYFLRNPVFYK